MRFGINSLLFTDSFVERDLALFARARGLGFDLLEISPVDLGTFPTAAVRRAAADEGMAINMNFALPAEANTISPERDVRRRGVELSKRVVDACVEVGAEIYCGANYCAWKYFTGKPRSEDEWLWAVESFRDIAAHAAGSGLLLAVETLNRFESHFLNTAADALRFVEEVGTANVSVHLDTFHMIREEDDMAAAIRGCGDRLGYFHACGSQRGVPGKDLVPWVDALTAVRDVGYRNGITIESFHPDLSIAPLVAVWRHFAATPDDLAAEGRAFLKRMYGEIWGGLPS